MVLHNSNVDRPALTGVRGKTATRNFLKLNLEGSYVVGLGSDLPKEVSIHFGVVEIGPDAFKFANIRSIEIPSSVKCISDSAFFECRNLQSIGLTGPLEALKFLIILDERGKSVIEVCEGFKGPAYIPEGVERIGNNAFLRSRVTEVRLPKSLRIIGFMAFIGCHKFEVEGHIDHQHFEHDLHCLLKSFHDGEYNHRDATFVLE